MIRLRSLGSRTIDKIIIGRAQNPRFTRNFELRSRNLGGFWDYSGPLLLSNAPTTYEIAHKIRVLRNRGVNFLQGGRKYGQNLVVRVHILLGLGIVLPSGLLLPLTTGSSSTTRLVLLGFLRLCGFRGSLRLLARCCWLLGFRHDMPSYSGNVVEAPCPHLH